MGSKPRERPGKGADVKEKYGRPLPDANRVYTALEAQFLLRTSYPTLMKRVKCGALKAGKVGGQWYFPGAELLRAFGVAQEEQKTGVDKNGDQT